MLARIGKAPPSGTAAETSVFQNPRAILLFHAGAKQLSLSKINHPVLLQEFINQPKGIRHDR